MDITGITQLISSLGFPIVVCGVLFWYLTKEREAHKEETSTLTKTLEDNTKVLSELSTLLKTFLTNEKR